MSVYRKNPQFVSRPLNVNLKLGFIYCVCPYLILYLAFAICVCVCKCECCRCPQLEKTRGHECSSIGKLWSCSWHSALMVILEREINKEHQTHKYKAAQSWKRASGPYFRAMRFFCYSMWRIGFKSDVKGWHWVMTERWCYLTGQAANANI